MTREEQIREASIDYQLSTNPRAIGGDAFADFAREMNVNQSFISGAKWADKTIIEKACEWLEEHVRDYKYYDADFADVNIDVDDLIYTFKKSMEE